MSFVKRVSDVVRSNLNSLLDAAEDPEKLIEQAILDMKEQEKLGRRKLLEIATLHKQAINNLDRQKKSIVELERQATEALGNNQEDLARAILLKKQTFEERVAEEEKQTNSIAVERETLQKTIESLPSQIDAARKKRDDLSKRMLRAKKAGADRELDALRQEARDYVNDTTAFDTYDRMIEKIDNLEAHAEALQELHELDAKPGREVSEKELRKLDAEAALVALKRQMGNPNSDNQSAATKAQQIEDEIGRLKGKITR